MAAVQQKSPWVTALETLPVKLRLEVQRGVAQDLVAQGSLPPQPALSRAYASGCAAVSKVQPNGLGAPACSLDGMGVGRRPTGPGHHASAVSRSFPSSSSLVASLLGDAVKAAGVTPRVAWGDASRTGEEALASEVQAAGLDAAYRMTLARYLQRTYSAAPAGGAAGAEPRAPLWREELARQPERYAHLEAAVDGSLIAQAQEAFDARFGRAPAPSAPAPAAAPAGKETEIDLDALLDELM